MKILQVRKVILPAFLGHRIFFGREGDLAGVLKNENFTSPEGDLAGISGT
jgi:hypothetical protein